MDELEDFFHGYVPLVTAAHHTCVGLALELCCRLKKLENRFPGLTESLYLVSCEEWIESLPEYVDFGDHLDAVADTLEKEHVMLALKINVAGRTGVLLCDPGYHVARVITVMKDKAYPHTGWFIQSEEASVSKEYNYSFSKFNSKYIEWTERETRNGIQKTQTSLVYVSRPYMTAIDVTERRNLVYDFRSLLSRDTKGHLIAGCYFKIKPGQQEFTVFYQNQTGRERVKMNFNMFLKSGEINEEQHAILKLCNQQLNLPENGLISTFHDLSKVMSDNKYLNQLLTINTNINTIAEVN